MAFTDLTDELIARILFTVFERTGKIKDVISLISTNKELYYKFMYLPYIWFPYTITDKVPHYRNCISVASITRPITISMKPFKNIRSLYIKISNLTVLKLLSTLTPALKQLTVVIDEKIEYTPAKQIKEVSSKLICQFKLDSFRLSSMKPIMALKYRNLLTGRSIRKKFFDKVKKNWDKFLAEFGDLFYVIVYLSRQTIKFIQIELVDMALMFNNTTKKFKFDSLKLVSLDNSSIIRLHLWFQKFIKLNNRVAFTVNNSFNDRLLLSETNSRTWLSLKCPKLALDTIKANLDILHLG